MARLGCNACAARAAGFASAAPALGPGAAVSVTAENHGTLVEAGERAHPSDVRASDRRW